MVTAPWRNAWPRRLVGRWEVRRFWPLPLSWLFGAKPSKAQNCPTEGKAETKKEKWPDSKRKTDQISSEDHNNKKNRLGKFNRIQDMKNHCQLMIHSTRNVEFLYPSRFAWSETRSSSKLSESTLLLTTQRLGTRNRTVVVINGILNHVTVLSRTTLFVDTEALRNTKI